jgi:hypothetical protein
LSVGVVVTFVCVHTSLLVATQSLDDLDEQSRTITKWPCEYLCVCASIFALHQSTKLHLHTKI